MDRGTKGALIGAGVGGLGGAVVGGAVGGPAGAVVGLAGGAVVGGALGFAIGRNPTVVYQGRQVPIFIKHRKQQPKFSDIHMRHVSKEQLANLEQFFTTFNLEPGTSDIMFSPEHGDYYFGVDGVEYSLDPRTLELKFYRARDGRIVW
jgi:hypothetical protein